MSFISDVQMVGEFVPDEVCNMTDRNLVEKLDLTSRFDTLAATSPNQPHHQVK